MVHNKYLFLTLLFTLMLPKFSVAADDKIKFHGIFWNKYTVKTYQSPDPKTGFDVYGAYLRADYQFTPKWKTVWMVEGKTANPKLHLIHSPSGLDTLSLFMGFIEGKDMFRKNDQLRFGLQPATYVIPVQNLIKTRWMGMTLPQEAGFLSSVQNGMSYKTSINKKLSISTHLHNGNSVNGKTTENGEAGSAAFFYKASDKITVVANNEYSTKSGTVLAQNVANAAIFFANEKLRLNFEIAQRKIENSSRENAFGLTTHLDFSKKWGYYGRYFVGNEAFQTAMGSKALFTTGPTYSADKNISFALVYDSRLGYRGALEINTVSLLVQAVF